MDGDKIWQRNCFQTTRKQRPEEEMCVDHYSGALEWTAKIKYFK